MYEFIKENKIVEKITKSKDMGLNFIKSEEFITINAWIFENHKELMENNGINNELLIDWLQRKEFNYKFLYLKSDSDFFTLVSIINHDITYYLPWVWTLVIKILISENNDLKEYVQFIPYFIKFGVNSKERLVDLIYNYNKGINNEDLMLTKEDILTLLSSAEE